MEDEALAADGQIRRLRAVQNAAARLLSGADAVTMDGFE